MSKRLAPAALLCILSPFVCAQQPAAPSAEGIWLGTLHADETDLRLQFHLHPATGACSLDSIDQKAFTIPCRDLKVEGNSVSLNVPAAPGHFTGELSADGKKLTGTWTQGRDLPLTLERQSVAIVAPAKVARVIGTALPPVPIADLKSVLDRDLANALASGDLAPSTHAGVTIGVLQHGVRRIFCYGTAQPNFVFEIGSISKTFTALILAQMVEQHTVRLDEPVRELLPPGTVTKPDGGEITLLDLSDQHSGLPRMPDNFHPANPANPYADYDTKHLYAYLAKQGVALPHNAGYGYSNLGVGLLGQALSNRAGIPYPQLLHDQVTGPLGMADTAVILTPSMSSRFIQGHKFDHTRARVWDFDALAGAGGIRSTAADMLTYLEAQLHPGRLPASISSFENGKTLESAIKDTHQVHAKVGGTMSIALNWFLDKKTGSYWHNGGTGGYASYATFNLENDFAVIVLSNTAAYEGTDFIGDLGLHIAQRIMGEQAVVMNPVAPTR